MQHFTFIELDKLRHVGRHETHFGRVLLEHHILQVPAAHTDTNEETESGYKVEGDGIYTPTLTHTNWGRATLLTGYLHAAIASMAFTFAVYNSVNSVHLLIFKLTDSYKLIVFTKLKVLLSRGPGRRTWTQFASFRSGLTRNRIR